VQTMEQARALTTSPQRVQAEAQSLLLADCGSAWTKVALIGLVDGQYRFLARASAPTTIGSPHRELVQGILEATSTIERIVGRRLIENAELIRPHRPTGEGIDAVLVVTSAGEPLRVALIGAVTPQQIDTLLRAAAATYCTTRIFSLLAESDAPDDPVTPSVQEAARFQPQALVLADQPPPELGEPLTHLLRLLRASAARDAPPVPIVLPGTVEAIAATRRLLDRQGEIHPLPPLVAGQPGPASLEFARLYERMAIGQIPGSERARLWTGRPLHATAQSLGGLVRFLAQYYKMNVICVDVGSTATAVLSATDRGPFFPAIHASAGVGSSATAVIEQAGGNRVARWLPFPAVEDQLRLYAHDKATHPERKPATPTERHIEQALAREAILLTLANPGGSQALLPMADLIVGTGGCFARACSAGEAVLLLLDTIQPRGICSLLLDADSILPGLGELGLVYPAAAVQVTEHDGVLHRLGPCVVPWGAARPGDIALRVQLDYADGRSQSVEVPYGTITVLPLGLGEHGMLNLFPAPSVDVGLGRGMPARSSEEIDGGLIGLIIDARGRPLEFSADPHEQMQRMRQWLHALAG